jgi:hypothetical protein
VVPESKLVEQYSTADDGLECFSKFIVIDNWIAGEYTIHSEMSITQAINDGLDDYEPHTTEYDFIVTVQ